MSVLVETAFNLHDHNIFLKNPDKFGRAGIEFYITDTALNKYKQYCLLADLSSNPDQNCPNSCLLIIAYGRHNCPNDVWVWNIPPASCDSHTPDLSFSVMSSLCSLHISVMGVSSPFSSSGLNISSCHRHGGCSPWFLPSFQNSLPLSYFSIPSSLLLSLMGCVWVCV